MISDRPYMRDDYGRQKTSVLTWVLCILGAAFVVQNIFIRWLNRDISGAFMDAVELSPAALVSGKVWTLFTYGLIHDPDQLFHIIGNLLGLYFIGRVLLPIMGSQRFIGLLVGAVLVGGLCWLAVNWQHGGHLLGASAAVCALFVVFACLQPNQPITFLIFFIIPVKMKPKYMAWGLLAFDLFGLLFWEMPGQHGDGIAHSAHLGGMLAGWVYFQVIHQRSEFSYGRKSAIELPRWFRKARKSDAPPASFKVNLSGSAELRAEMDRILDKINSEGFQSLTPEEKKHLDQARDHLSRR
ncbi:rhomboid family intramembrane serine protease [Rariglobus hedericola]|nr:rhomboid family intramembrane serine protease [Rariglobus hedericola]